MGQSPGDNALREFKAAGTFEINEPSLRLLLSVVVISAAISAGVLAVMAAKIEQNSLWYAMGIFASMAALTELSFLIAGIYALVFGFAVMWRRQWKMTLA